MTDSYKVVTAPTLSVYVSSSVSSFGSERRFQKDLTVEALKGKLEMITGAMASSMGLEVYNKDNKLVCKLEDDSALLGSHQIDDGMRIHVIDKSGAGGQFEDVSQVEKYEMTEDDYAKRTDSVRAFKEKHKLGRFNPEEQQRKEQERTQKETEEEELAKGIKVGNRCEVRVPKQPTKRGTVMFVGEVHFKPGQWVGVKYDEPMGKNDGSVQGKRYFECPDKYGGFVRPSNVTVGDFPEEDLGLSDEEMDEM